VNMYIVSGDTTSEQLQLYHALVDKFGSSLPFVSDPDLDLIDLFGMKNGDSAFRGYGMLDKDGNVVFYTINDLWGEEFDETVDEIKKEYQSITN
jgi:alkyl hydroperoxide reductase subunit AhpC